jgi:hypothetical protein
MNSIYLLTIDKRTTINSSGKSEKGKDKDLAFQSRRLDWDGWDGALNLLVGMYLLMYTQWYHEFVPIVKVYRFGLLS